MIEISDPEFALMSDYLEKLCGIAVPSEKRYLFMIRLADFMREKRCPNFASLYTQLTLRSDPQLCRQLIQAMTNHESSFFRDGHPFATFRQQLLPALAARRHQQARVFPPRLRFLCCGCSAGQEPYSVAMCIHDWLDSQDTYGPADITLLAFDVSGAILERARTAVYTDAEVGSHLPEQFRSRYFSRVPGGWQVCPQVRAMVQFLELNLVDNISYAGKFDGIFCRNVIIYFSLAMKKRILLNLANLLQPDGVLLLGASESVYKLADQLRPVHVGQTTYYVTSQPSPLSGSPLSPRGANRGESP